MTKLRIIGGTIELDRQPVATLTIAEGTLLERLRDALDNASRDVDRELAGAYDDGYKAGKDESDASYQSGYDAGRRDAERDRGAA